MALPEFRPPQLATLVDDVPEGDDWLFEMKYDGYRALAASPATEVRIYTRNGNDWTDTVRAAASSRCRKLTKGSALIDGEICAFNDDGRTDFSTLQDALSTGAPLVYFAFDLLEQDGEDLEKLPLIERKERLRKLLGKLRKDGADPVSPTTSSATAQKVFEAMCDAGQEGVIAKHADAPYRHERTKTWLKIKCHRSARNSSSAAGGRRTRSAGFASLLLGTWEDGKLDLSRPRRHRLQREERRRAAGGARQARAQDRRLRERAARHRAPRQLGRARARRRDRLSPSSPPTASCAIPRSSGCARTSRRESVKLEKPVSAPAAEAATKARRSG